MLIHYRCRGSSGRTRRRARERRGRTGPKDRKFKSMSIQSDSWLVTSLRSFVFITLCLTFVLQDLLQRLGNSAFLKNGHERRLWHLRPLSLRTRLEFACLRLLVRRTLLETGRAGLLFLNLFPRRRSLTCQQHRRLDSHHINTLPSTFQRSLPSTKPTRCQTNLTQQAASRILAASSRSWELLLCLP